MYKYLQLSKLISQRLVNWPSKRIYILFFYPLNNGTTIKLIIKKQERDKERKEILYFENKIFCKCI